MPFLNLSGTGMGQTGFHKPLKAFICQRSLLGNERARLAAMLFKQLHIGDDHAPVDGFAHVVDGQQGDLDGGQESGDSPRTDPSRPPT